MIELLVERALEDGIELANNEMESAYELYQMEKVSLTGDGGRLTPIVNDIVAQTINRLAEQMRHICPPEDSIRSAMIPYYKK